MSQEQIPVSQQVDSKSKNSRFLGVLSLVPLVLDPLVPAFLAVVLREKSVHVYAYGFVNLSSDHLPFTAVNVLPIVSFLLGGIAAWRHRSLAGAFSCGCGVTILLGRLFYALSV